MGNDRSMKRKRPYEENEFSGIMTRSKKRKVDRMMTVYVRLERIDVQIEKSTAATNESTLTIVGLPQRKNRTDGNTDGILPATSSTGDAQFSLNKWNKTDDKEKKITQTAVGLPKQKNDTNIISQPTNSTVDVQCNIASTSIDTKGKSSCLTLAKPDFKINDIVWGKIKGSPHWPAKIDRITATSNGLIMYELVWYNDYRRTKVNRLQVFNFLDNFEKFAKRFGDIIGLKTAGFEAMYEYRRKMM